jgi:hypothetical protein
MRALARVTASKNSGPHVDVIHEYLTKDGGREKLRRLRKFLVRRVGVKL